MLILEEGGEDREAICWAMSLAQASNDKLGGSQGKSHFGRKMKLSFTPLNGNSANRMEHIKTEFQMEAIHTQT